MNRITKKWNLSVLDCCFSELALLKSNSACWSRTKWTSSSYHWKLTCSRHDIVEKLLNYPRSIALEASTLTIVPPMQFTQNEIWVSINRITINEKSNTNNLPVSGQAKGYKIGICCFSSKYAALRRKSKDWLARNRNNVLSGATCLPTDCCFSELTYFNVTFLLFFS
jgi:hypothetical protein